MDYIKMTKKFKNSKWKSQNFQGTSLAILQAYNFFIYSHIEKLSRTKL
jgi:hypothetical protein